MVRTALQISLLGGLIAEAFIATAILLKYYAKVLLRITRPVSKSNPAYYLTTGRLHRFADRPIGQLLRGALGVGLVLLAIVALGQATSS